MMKRLAITGSSGYLGTRFIEHVRSRRDDVEILGLDIRPPAQAAAASRFVELDVLDPKLADALLAFRPDTVVHAAFVLAPIRDRSRMRRINVDGCRNVLAAAAGCGVQRVMLVSSATAYGAWPDNPVPMDETWPLRAAKFQYAADKVEIERLADRFAAQYPGVAVSRVRPAIIGGPGMDNYLSRFIFGMPSLVLMDGHDTPLQFVHEDDVVAAMLAILSAGARGPFNVAPPDWVSIREIAMETGRRTVRLPFGLAKAVHGILWGLRFPGHETPPEFLDFARFPWTVTPRRLQGELGFGFQHSSLETLREGVRAWQRRGQGAAT